MRSRRTFNQHIAFLHDVAVLNRQMTSFRDQILNRLTFGRNDGNPLFGLVVFAELDHTVNIGDNCRIFRAAGFKQLGNARQTAGNIFGLGAFSRNTRDNVADFNLVTVVNRQNGVCRHIITDFFAVVISYRLAFGVFENNARFQTRAGGIGAPVNNNLGNDTCRFVSRFANRNIVNQVNQLNLAGFFGDDRNRKRIPLGNLLALLNFCAFGSQNLRAVRNMVTRFLAVIGVDNHNLAVARQNNAVAFRVDDHMIVFELENTGKRNFNRSLLGAFLSRAANVERSHRQLGTGFADGLRGDNADRLADIDRRTAGQVAAVARGADTVFGFAGQNRTDLNLFDTGCLNNLNVVFVNQFSFGNQNFAGFGMNNVFLNCAAEDSVADGNDNVAAVDNRTNNDAALGAAVGLGNDDILRNVDQTTGKVTGVRGFQSRIGQTFTGTVGGIKVFQHRQTFFKVRDNRLFDNLARRFGHQAAHASQLAHLRGGTAGAGVSHHVNGVDVTVFGLGDVFHHLVGNLVGTGSPDIDHLVVLLALVIRPF